MIVMEFIMSERDLLAIVLEDMNRKFDLVLDAYAAQNEEMKRSFEKVDARFEDLEAAIRFTNVDLRKRIDAVEQKVDAVAEDLSAHRTDTEGHTLYRVKEGN